MAVLTAPAGYRIVALMWVALFLPLSASAACPEDPEQALVEDLRSAERAFSDQNRDDVTIWANKAQLDLGCLNKPIDPLVAAQYHRVRGELFQLVEAADSTRSEEGFTAEALSFAAARRLDPKFTFAEDIAPTTGVLYSAYN